MATKKTAGSGTQVVDFLAKHGSGGTSAVRYGDHDDRSVIIPCGITSIDLLTSKGGFRTGRVVILTGDENTGKTTTELLVCANAIARFGYPCLFIDTEGRYESNIASANGVPVEDHEHFWLSQYEPPDPTKTEKEQGDHWRLTIQHLPALLRDFSDSKQVLEAGGGVIVLDSLNTTMNAEFEQGGVEFGGGAGNFTIPKILSGWGRELSSRLRERNILMMITVQLRGNVDMGAMGRKNPNADKTLIPGGWAIRYNNSLMLSYKKGQRLTTGSGAEIEMEGLTIKVTAVKSTAGNFGAQTSFVMSPKYGPDIPREIIKYGQRYGIVTVRGAFYTFHLPAGDMRFQGIAKVQKWLIDNPVVMAELREDIRLKAMSGARVLQVETEASQEIEDDE